MNVHSHQDFVAIMPEVAKALLGDPTHRPTKTEWRYGTHGSLAVNLGNATWFDFEANKGGGVIDLIRREGHEPAEWLRSHDFEEPPKGDGHDKAKIVATYDYTDERGELVYQAVRFEPKRFLQRRPSPEHPGQWIWNLQGVKPLPYRLPELIEAVALDHRIFISEGEKDVDNLRRHGLDATTNSGGAGKWRAEFADYFAGADVVLLPHHDDAGRKHADDIARSLISKASRIRILDLPGLEPKADVSDWFEAGGTVEQFNKLVDEAPDWRPEAEPERIRKIVATSFRWRNPATLPRRTWIYGRHYVRRYAVCTVGIGALGKSTLLLTESIAIALQAPILGLMPSERTNVWYWNGEDPQDETERRIAAICQHHQIDGPHLQCRLFTGSGRVNPIKLAQLSRGELVFDDALVKVPEWRKSP